MTVQSPMRDLVIVALPGVQRLISEARSTADVRAGSEMVARLAEVAARYLREHGCDLVIPGEIGVLEGVPNRVVALASGGSGVLIAERAAEAVRDEWRDLLCQVFEQKEPMPTPGIPAVLWVSVPDDGRGYGWQWGRAQTLLAARRRVRDFEPQEWSQREICTLSPHWPAEEVPPPGLKDHEQATLSAANWVKRRWQRTQDGDRFPSTSSIASAPFRREVLRLAADSEVGSDINAAITALRGAADEVGGSEESRVAGLPTGDSSNARWFSRSGGPWVYPERWQPRSLGRDTGRDAKELHGAAENGRKALDRLVRAAEKYGVCRPTDYLAIVVQDLDGMGRFLGGQGVNTITVDPDVHRSVSGLLGQLAAGQRTALQHGDLLGVPVYAGGDDLLAFTPASTALTAAQTCHDLNENRPQLPTASTAVLFFHHQAGLQVALTRARELLDTAKEQVSGKHALAVGYLRRSGVREFSIHPWSGADGKSPAERFRVFGRLTAHPLSPRLVADMERDTAELGGLYRRDQKLYQAELTRLVERHLGGEKKSRPAEAARVAAALLELGGGASPVEVTPVEVARRTASAARVGVFLRQEAR